MLTRRSFIKGAGATGFIHVAPGLSIAQAPGNKRFVLLILRGGMDGLHVVQPYGDQGFAGLRPSLALTPEKGLFDLDGFFGLAPGLAPISDLWKAKELAFVHAVSSPYRRRSHFEAQDTLENGTGSNTGAADGWLNRLLAALPNASSRDFAADFSPGGALVLEGTHPVTRWVPTANIRLTDEIIFFLKELYDGHRDFADALSGAMKSEEEDLDGPAAKGATVAGGYAKLAAKMLSGKARIGVLSLRGWDSHQNQSGMLNRSMRSLADVITTLKTDLGPKIWQETTVVAVSEFGRTARANGTGGTDHGTGGLMILAGGAISGGRVYGRWPGLSEDDLFEGRDLTPTGDVRSYLGWTLMQSFGVQKSALADKVFPGVELGSDPFSS